MEQINGALIKSNKTRIVKRRKVRLSVILPRLLTLLLAVIVLLPFYITVLMAFKTPQETFQSFYGLPKVFRLDNFINAWKISNFSLAFKK